MNRLAAARVVTPGGVLEPGTVTVDRDRIVAVEQGSTSVPAAEVLDGLLVPGFVDLQVNGLGAVDVASADATAWAELDRRLVAAGVTAWCPTLVSAPLEAYEERLSVIAAAAARGGALPAVLGAHLEGPFLGGAPGAHPREHVVPLDREWLLDVCERWPIRIVTLAPELPGAAEAVPALAARGVTVALGHSMATYEEAVAAAGGGARLVTHCFNAMAPLHHRRPGLLGAALSDERLVVSLIADLVHVHPAVLALTCRAKGRGGYALVSDAVAWERDGSGGPTDAPRLADGTLAGSARTIDRGVANLVMHAGVPLVDAIDAASTTPARLIGAVDRGRIAPGCRADLVLLDAGLEVRATWIGGERSAP